MGFPRFEIAARRGEALRKELIAKVHEQVGVTVDPQQRIATIKHGVTRFRITLDCYAATLISTSPNRAGAAAKMVSAKAIEGYPLSVTGRKLSRLLLDATPS